MANTRGPVHPVDDDRGRSAPLRVVVADGDPMARRVIVAQLRSSDVSVVAEAISGPEAVALCCEHEPDVLLTESALPGLGGVDVTRQLSLRAPSVRIVFLSAAIDDELQLRALRAGAHGFLSKQADIDGLARALLAVDRGEAAISRRATMRVIESLRTLEPDGIGMRPVRSVLTGREWEVVDLLTAGASTHDVAATLFLTPDTVYSHVKSIMRKLGVHDRAAAVDEARRLKRGVLAA